MNTTSDTGEKVPVPDRCISNGGWQRATSARCALIAARSATATSVGGSSVTCGGTSVGLRVADLRPPVDQQLRPRLRDRDDDAEHGVLRRRRGRRGTKVSSFMRRGPAAGARKPTRS